MTSNRPTPTSVPAWSSPADAARLIARGYTFGTCFRVALVVGTVLSIVNQGATVIAGHTTAVTAVRIGVNYLVPFLVSSIGYLVPFRAPRATDQL